MFFKNNCCSSAGFDLVGISATLATFISQNTSLEDLAILAALFTTIGDNLALIATAKSACETKNETLKSEASPPQYDNCLGNFNK